MLVYNNWDDNLNLKKKKTTLFSENCAIFSCVQERV